MRGRLCCKDSPKILRNQGREVARDGRALDIRGLLTCFPARYGLPADGGIRRSQRRPRPRHDRLRRNRFDRLLEPRQPDLLAPRAADGRPAVLKLARSIAQDVVQWGQMMCMEHDSPIAMRWRCYKATVNEPETMAAAKPLRWAGFMHGLRVPAGSPIERS
jgi:hypothetical protein